MPGVRENGRRGGGSSSNNLLKAALTACMIASAGASTGPSCSSSAVASPPTARTGNRWVSKALATRGGADEPAETAEGIPGVLSEVEIAVSSFNDIVGEHVVEVDNAKKGTTKEVSRLWTEGEGV